MNLHEMDIVKWFEDIGKADVNTAGDKGANLGELVKAGLPVPPGYVITAQAYLLFTTASGLSQRIVHAIEGIDVDDTSALKSKAKEIQDSVIGSEMPANINSEILKAYDELARRESVKSPFVAVRSSATMEDSEQASFAGMNATFLNVHGREDLIRKVKECWASLYSARLIFYRDRKGFLDEPVIAIVVQTMVNSDKAGVMFTANPRNNNLGSMVIEGAFGLGEVVVRGLVSPDYYEIDKAGMKVRDTRISHKDFKIIRDEKGRNKNVDLSEKEANEQVLTDKEIQQIAGLGMKIEQHYGSPQDTEWAIGGSDVYILQSRPIAMPIKVIEKINYIDSVEQQKQQKLNERALVRGLGASPGIVTGFVRNIGESDPLLMADMKPHEVVVAKGARVHYYNFPGNDKDFLNMSSAWILDDGGLTCGGAIVARELGIPCVTGTKYGTSLLKTGQKVTVDGAKGVIYSCDEDNDELNP